MNEWIDEITSTYSVDRDFSDLMSRAPYSSLIAELLVWNTWRNQHMGAYLGFLPKLADKRFKRDLVELGIKQSSQLIIATARDLSLPVYLSVRGLPIDGLFFLRRALEHLAVLTHIWKYTNRLKVLESPDSEMYRNAFQLGPPNYNGRAKQWRFEAFALLGKEASDIYRILSSYAAHGGPMVASASGESHLTCQIVSRDSPTDHFREALEVMIECTQIATVNLCALFRHYMHDKGLFENAVSSANGEAFALLKSAGRSQGPTAMSEAVSNILKSI